MCLDLCFYCVTFESFSEKMSGAAPSVPKQFVCRRGDELLPENHRGPEVPHPSHGVRQTAQQRHRPEVRDAVSAQKQ